VLNEVYVDDILTGILPLHDDGHTASLDEIKGPLVSVVVTNFNYAKYLPQCLRSIAAQSYPHFECIVVDDCSTDESVAVIEDFIANDAGGKSFELVASSTNGGQMSGFIKGFRQTKGAFVVFVDADDFLFPDFLETHLKAHLNSRISAGLSCSDEVVIDHENRLLAGSYSRFFQSGPLVKASKLEPAHTPINCDWTGEVDLIGDVVLNRANPTLVHISANDFLGHKWVWTTTSAMMFRRGLLDLALSDRVRDVRICADFYLVHFCHRLGGTLLIDGTKGGYRVHGKNNFAPTAVLSSDMLTGTLSGQMSYGEIWDRILTEVCRQYSTIVSLVGKAKALRLLASLSHPGAIGRVWRTIGIVDISSFATFLILMAVITAKRRMTWLRRVVDFV
jgi:glycosyltransferase involved in cell wall biosynthesis